MKRNFGKSKKNKVQRNDNNMQKFKFSFFNFPENGKKIVFHFYCPLLFSGKLPKPDLNNFLLTFGCVENKKNQISIFPIFRKKKKPSFDLTN